MERKWNENGNGTGAKKERERKKNEAVMKWEKDLNIK